MTESGLAVARERGAPAAEPERTLGRWTIPAALAGVLVVAVAVTLAVSAWVGGHVFADADRQVGAVLDVIRIGSSVAVGGGGMVALYLAARRQRTQEFELRARHAELARRDEELVNRRAELTQRDLAQAHTELTADRTHELASRAAEDTRSHARAQRITDSYAKSAELLGSEKTPVRMAGLYALERLAQDNPSQRQTILNLLCACLHMPFDPVPAPPGREADPDAVAAHREWLREREVRLTAQRLLTDHLRPGEDRVPSPAFWPDLDLDLAGATLIDLDLSGCEVRSLTCVGTSFTGVTSFHRARFGGVTSFRDARFAGGAWFEGAEFGGRVRFDEAKFGADAHFTGTVFVGEPTFDRARFGGIAWFEDARFGVHAQFGGARFAAHARFDRAEFGGAARFDGAEFRRVAWFDDARFGEGTRFDRVDYGRTTSLEGCLTVPPVPGRSTWPPGWRPAVEGVAVKGLDGVWHRLVRD
ncbi:pentapeptide repeat-containing protein [Actinosynnema sp. NPDC020468]|uniref:pentapeptide repeat-containing protein n=1 Tax=Actinosynnema sp. NPDC020468 TaxID=3154488 RepID=UPI0033EE0EE6